MYKLKGSPGRTITIDEKEFLYFSGTAYLGMPKDPDFLILVKEGLSRYGTNYGGSRLANIEFDIIEKAEQLLAKITHTEAALTCSSGTVAGQLLVHHFSEETETYASPDAHPAMIPPGNLTIRLSENWTEKIISILKKTDKPVVLFTNAVNPLKVEQHNFSWLKEVPKDAKFTLVIDDSHSLGICGKNGGGINTIIDIPKHINLIILSSLGKAFGIPAGVVLGSKKLIRALWKSPLFGGASPTILAYLYAFVEGQDIYKRNRACLTKNVAYFSTQLENKDSFKNFKGYPVFSVQDNNLAGKLYNQGIILSSFHYPSPSSPLATRIIISSLHKKTDLDQLIKAIK